MKTYSKFKKELQTEDGMMNGDNPSTIIYHSQADDAIGQSASVEMTVPKYRISEDEKGCNVTCSHWRDQTWCNEYKFKCDPDYTCNSWSDSGI